VAYGHHGSPGAWSAEMKTLVLLASLLFFATQSPAKVLVYKGTFTTKTGPVGIRPTLTRCFFLFDPDVQQAAFVVFSRDDGEKILQVGPPAPVQVASVDLLQGKTATTISLNTSETPNPPSFTNGLFYLRGTNATLKIASDNLTTSIQPRFLRGSNDETGITQGLPFFIESKIVLTYQEQRSIQANDANQSISDVSAGLGQELRAKGFQD
jgi:hypothetical protein